MNRNIITSVVGSIFLILSCASCKRSNSYKALPADTATQSNAPIKITGPVRQFFNHSRKILPYMQNYYAHEFALIENIEDSEKESAALATNIKKIAIKRHEHYLSTWLHTFHALAEADYTRTTPLFHYQDQLEADFITMQRIVQRLKRVVNNADANQTELLEWAQTVFEPLTQLHELVRFDLDFMRDKQAYALDRNTRYKR